MTAETFTACLLRSIVVLYILKINRVVEARLTRYFCCRLTPAGIGDQISQLQRLYNIGRSFGLEYVFRELPTNRWSPDLNASDFLGLSLDEQRVEDFPDHEIVSVDGAAASYALLDGRPLASVLPTRMPDRAIVEFVHSRKMYSNGIPVQVLHGIDLRAKLIRRHGESELATNRKNRLSICVHIRQGDCTWVKCGDRYVFLGMRKITSDPKDVDVQRAPHVDAYVPLLDTLVSSLDGQPYDLTVYSDGPANIFPVRSSLRGRLRGRILYRILYRLARRDERIIDWLRRNRVGNTLQALYNPMCDVEVRQAYDQVRTGLLRLVARYKNATLVTGTSKELTAQAILAFASADIVLLARNPGVFPLLGLGDPQDQAVLLLSLSAAENKKRVDDLMAYRKARSETGDR